jgi:outer membrane receptor for ferric coprogen and ferric-rhodotorulic acid
MHSTRHPISIAAVLAAASFGIPILSGQSLPSPDKSKSPAADEEIVVLSPFEVNSARDSGYMSAEAATGTRYAAPIMEVPISVQAITSEFIEDFFAFELNDVVAYTSGFVPAEGTGAFTVRGIRSTSGQYKNGMREGGIYGPVAVDRVEIVRGPNAAIYGATEPSGLRNVMTKNPSPKPSASLRLAGGTDDFYRVAIDVNQPLTRRTLLTRFAASIEENGQYVQDFSHFRRKNLYNSTTWKIGPNTTFTWHLDYIQYRNQAQNAGTMPFVQMLAELPNATGDYSPVAAYAGQFGSGIWQRFQNMNISGKGANGEMEYTQIDANFTHQFSRWLSLRVLASRWQRNQDILRTAVGTPANRSLYDQVRFDDSPGVMDYIVPLLTTTSPRGSVIYYLTDTSASGAGSYLGGTLGGTYIPRYERNRETQATAQADLLATFKTGPISHKLLFTADYAINDAHSRQFLSIERDTNPANATTGRNDPASPDTWTAWGGLVVLDDFFWGDWSFTNPGFSYTFGGDQWNYSSLHTDRQIVTKGLMLSERASFFNNRLIAFIGARHDEITITQTDFLNPMNNVGEAMRDYAPGEMVRYAPDRAVTMQSGILYKIMPELSAYVNYSESFNPNRTDGANRDIHRNPLPAQRGEGLEAGIKASLFSERLNFTLTYYDTDKKKVPRTARDTDGTAFTIPGSTDAYSNLNDINTRGVELDLNCRATPALNFLVAAAYNKVSYTWVQNATEQYLLQVPPDSTPRWIASAAFTYKVNQGTFKGLNLRLGVRYMGAMIVNNSTASVFGNSKVRAPDISIGNRTYRQYYFENPAYILVEGGIGYGWRSGKINHNVGINLKNALDTIYMRGSRPGDPMALILSYEIRR